MKQPHELIELELYDHIYFDYEIDNKEKYQKDCCNSIVCKSYGALGYRCVAGAFAKNKRCTNAEKIQILILNDSNPNAIYKPEKPSIDDLY